MKHNSSRRNFLAAGLAVPAVALASTGRPVVVDPPAAKGVAAPSGLKFRTLGKTGLKLTSVGFGCMITSDGSVIEKAADLGINYFDTARGYQGGNNERMVGAALKAKRNSIALSSKTGAPNKQGALEHLDTSLKELGTDHLDIWYLHGKSKASDLTDDLIEAQQIAKKAGKIRFAGVSMHAGHPEVVPAMIARKDHFDVALMSYNFTMDASMQGLIDSATNAGLGVVAMKVMAGGLRRAKPGEKIYDTFKREGALYAALKWVLRNPNVGTTIPSITDMDQLDENMRAMSESFTGDDEKLLAEHLEYIRPMYCRMCGECDGTCPKGVPVADVLRYLVYAEGYGEFRLGRESFLSLPDDVRAVRCGDCTTCSVSCANGVRVAERISRAQEVFA
jgi:uncharacterized protein